MPVMVENCIGAVASFKEQSLPVGGGFLVTRQHLLTCAHVVNAAAGHALDSQTLPEEKVRVFFLADKGATPIMAKIEKDGHWRPPLPGGAPSVSADMAILTLEKPAPEKAVVAPLRERYPLPGRAYSVIGFPKHWDIGQGQSGLIGEPDFAARFELKTGNDGRPPLRPGFSGSPVRVESTINAGKVGVVGMVVAARKDAQDNTAYMVPTEYLKSFLSDLQDIDIRNGIGDDFPHIRLLEEYFQATVLKDRVGPTFELRIDQFNSTEAIAQLFRSDPQEVYGEHSERADQFVDRQQSRLLLLQSPGGAGKSNFLLALVQSAISKGMVPFLLDATKGSIKLDASGGNLAALFDALAVKGGIDDFNKARDKTGKESVILLVDRLNENPAQAAAILKAVIRVAESEAPGIAVVVADRMNDRGEITPLKRATVLPLPLSEMERRLGYRPNARSAKLLAIPFFLKMQIESDAQGSGKSQMTRSEMFKAFFRVHVLKDLKNATEFQDALAKLAESAFCAYDKFKNTVMPVADWRQMLKLDSKLNSEIVSASMLEYQRENGKVVEFRHQLLHDFLVGMHLAQQGQLFWRGPNFATATLENQSYDAIEFAAEQLESKATEFVFQVYDWSWLGALETVRNLDAGRHGGESQISSEFKDALYFLNAMRVFDRFEDSRRRTLAIIAGVRTTGGLEPGSASNFKALRQMVQDHYEPKEEYFIKWRMFFLRDAAASLDDLTVLSSDPFMSWTATNILRTLPMNDAFPALLQQMYYVVRSAGGDRAEAVGVRWRFVHLLGVVSTPQSAEFLWSIAKDPQEQRNVRAGALRSYIENASLMKSRVVRQEMLTRIAAWMRAKQPMPPSIPRQLRTCARLADDCVVEGWHEDYMEILEAGIQYAADKNDAEERQAWERKKDEILAHNASSKN